MIKVIVSDLDGTLLNEQHELNERTIMAVLAAQEAGIRFMVASGRGFDQTIRVLKDIKCDYIVDSGAEIRNPQKEVLQSIFMDIGDCRAIYEILKNNDISYRFCSKEADYCIGSTYNRERELIRHLQEANPALTEEQARRHDLFQFMMGKTKTVSSFEEMESFGIFVVKILISTTNLELLAKIKEPLQQNPNLAVVSSFVDNLEITNIKAQKGIALKSYIEALGYTMDEVMVFGDSMNDYSMLSMDFGATVAMANGVETVKRAAKYITKSNAEDGVAYTIEELLKRRK